MDPLIFKLLVSSGPLGVVCVILFWLLNKERQVNKEHLADMKTLTRDVLQNVEKQTEAIVSTREVLRQQENTLDWFLKSAVDQRSFTPMGVPRRGDPE